MTPTVFIQTNHKQLVGALVSSYSLKRNSRNPERFDVRVIHTEDHPYDYGMFEGVIPEGYGAGKEGYWLLPRQLKLSDGTYVEFEQLKRG